MDDRRATSGDSPAHPAGLRAMLTFDAEHPSRRHHDAGSIASILDVLAARSVTATFFLQARWATANPETAARIASEGHAIGSHSTAHVAMTRLSDEGIAAEVTEAEDRIKEITGKDPKPLFRCPYGDGHDDDRVSRVISGLGYSLIGWDVDPEDWNDDRSGTDVSRFVLQQLGRARDITPIVLLHTWPSGTPAAVDRIIDGIPASWITPRDAIGD